MSVRTAFDQFDAALNLSPAEREGAQRLHREITDRLTQAGLIRDAFLQGSFARRTMRRPLHDVDKVVLLSDELRGLMERPDGPDAAMTELESVLGRSYNASFERKKHALTLRIVGVAYSFDIVPAFPTETEDDDVRIGNRETGTWDRSNTRELIRAVEKRNGSCSGHFIHQVRMAKEFVAEKIGADFPGLHTESLAYLAIQEPLDHDVACARFLTIAADHVAGTFSDPTGKDPLSQKLDRALALHAAGVFSVAADTANEAIRLRLAGDEVEAQRIWSALFGNVFPAVAPQTPDAAFRAAFLGGSVTSAGTVSQSSAGRQPLLPTRSWGATDQSRLGARLRRARIAAAITQDEAARALGVARPAVTLIESGQRAVASLELAKLAELYGASISSLLLEENSQQVAAFLRAEAPVNEASHDVLESLVGYFREYAFLEEEVYGQQRFELPLYPLPPGRAIDQGAWLAEQERRRLDVGHRPIGSLVELVESQGVKISVRALPAEPLVSGCYLFSPSLGPCMAIREGESAARIRYTMAHEYAHFLVDDRDSSEGQLCVVTRHEELREMRANAFAATFLLPESGVVALLNELRVEDKHVEPEHIVHVMYQFGVSYEAVVWRLVNLGVITRERRVTLMESRSDALDRTLGYTGQPGDDEPTPSRLRTIAMSAWRKGAISSAKLAELLRVSRRDLLRSLSEPNTPPKRVRRGTRLEPDWL